MPFGSQYALVMPRYARIHVTGGLFHVISRFHDRRFYLDLDGAREKYLELLGRAAQTHDSRVLAYSLMSSHVHLVLQLGNDPLGVFTKKIHSPFGIWVNSQCKGLGTILADRPKSVLVHSETYGMELIRYVHNNPVRAGVVDRASESSWSSHRAYLALDAVPEWLATDAVLGPEINEQEANRHEFACFVDEGKAQARRPEFSGEVSSTLGRRIRRLMGGDVELSYPVLGPDDFVLNSLRNQASSHRRKQNPQTTELDVGRIIEEVFTELEQDPSLARKRVKPAAVVRGRRLVAWLWVEIMGRPQVMVAEGLNVRPAAVAKMLSRLRREAK
jgi:REP element-mobilizing transposase RayT